MEQTGPKAGRLRKALERITLPPGFEIDLYAIAPDARRIAMGPQSVAIFVGARRTKFWAETDRDKDRVADEVKTLAPSLAFDAPNGPCFSKDGFPFIAERNRAPASPAAEHLHEGEDVAAFNVILEGQPVPPEVESYDNTARVCDFGPDGKLHISLGQPPDITPPDRLDAHRKVGIGGVIRLDADSTGREVFTCSERNSVGQDFHPVTGELNRQTTADRHFGCSWRGGGAIRTVEIKIRRPRGSCIRRSRQSPSPPISAWRSPPDGCLRPRAGALSSRRGTARGAAPSQSGRA